MSGALVGQVINLLAALMLLIAFAMLAQRRLLRLIHLFALQGAVLTLNTLVVAATLAQSHLYFSVVLNLVLKVIVLPMILIRLVDRLDLRADAESVGNLPLIMLVAIVLVILSFNVALPISELAGTITRGTLGIAMASVLIAFLMMITRRKAVAQVIGFLAMENGLFFAATSATYGMPMVVELGIALDVLVGTFIFGIFFFQIRETFDSLDTRNLERLKDRE
jgi:hydrogenase-4 component E